MAIPYRLGIDIGTNSLGWCILDLGHDQSPRGIRKIGVRIFSDGRAPDDTPLAVERRLARGARKRRQRFVDRRETLMNALVRHGLMPADAAERKALEPLNPYELRAHGLDALLHPHHLGRALFHMNQRRGFKSNRKTDRAQKADDLKGMKGGIAKLQGAIGDSTLGAYLYTAFREGRPVRERLAVRARPHVVKGKNEYDLYADRAMYEHEFDTLWRKQVELGAPLADAARDEIRRIIFHQRPLKPAIVGKCALDPTDTRAPLALPSVQRFRMLCELAHNAIIHPDQSKTPLTKAQRDKILAKLEGTKNLSFDKMRAMLSLGTEVKFSLESEKRKDLKGDITGIELAKKECFGPGWWTMPLTRRDAIVQLLLGEADEERLIATLIREYALDEERAANAADARLPDGYGRLGRKALVKIVPMLEAEVISYAEAASQVGYDHARGPDGEVFEQLPYYGQVLDYAVVDTGDEAHDTERRFGRIANPTVHVAMNELRKVVNALTKRYGAPAEIVVELARDLPLGKEARAEKEKEQKKKQDKNDDRRKTLAGLGLPENGETMMRLRLWEELNEDNPMDRRCVYTGEVISIARLFGAEVEIEHILPFKRTLDNSPANKTVSMRRANRAKGNRTPFEAFHTGTDGYDWDAILLRATNLPKNKRWRFGADAMDRFEGERDFLDRQLVDTQYISKLARDYLTKIAGPYKVWVVTGRLTQMLRGKWGLDSLISDHNRKNRFDHRHHAIDAFVVGCTDRGMLKRVADAADQFRDRLIDDMPDPWEGFRDELGARLDKVIVAHKPDHGIAGKLHEATAYGIVKDPSKEDGATLVYRKPLKDLNANEICRIRDKKLRAEVMEAVGPAKDDKKALPAALAAFSAESGIRHVRLTKVEEGFVTLKDPDDKPYKALTPGENAYVEIYRTPDGKWKGEGVTVFDANQKNFRPKWRSDSPEARLVMRVHKGDIIKLNDGSLMRVCVLEPSADRVRLATHKESGSLDKRHKDDNDAFRWLMPSYSRLKQFGARKVTVDCLGRVNDPGPFQ